MHPLLFGEEMAVTVEKRTVAKRIRGPKLDTCAVLADSPDLAEDVIRLLEVLEEMRRED
jgi:hypothetical protein